MVETKNEEVFVETPVEEKEEPESADPDVFFLFTDFQIVISQTILSNHGFRH